MGRNKHPKGVTIYELLIVLALLGLLALLAMFGWRVQLARARDAERKASLKQLQLAFQSYREDAGCYPPEEEIYCDSEFLSPYLPFVPCDPSNSVSYNFKYVSDECDMYTMYTKLEWENDEDIADLGCTNGCGPEDNYNYFITSSEIPSTGANVEGERPTCGINADICIPNVCSECCPGSNYRCNSAGDRCIFDASCAVTPTP